MGVFVRAVITGFGFSVGKAIYDRVNERFFGDSEAKAADETTPDVVPEDADLVTEPD
jgi:hypothetical protein